MDEAIGSPYQKNEADNDFRNIAKHRIQTICSTAFLRIAACYIGQWRRRDLKNLTAILDDH